MVNFTTIVRTNFPNFDNEADCQRDRKAMRKENSKLSNIVNSAKVIYVDNPPMIGRPKAIELAKEIRAESRQILLTHLGTCQTVYKPNNLGNLNQRIGNYMSDKEKLEKEIKEKERLIREQNERMNKQINEVRERGERQIRELGSSKELEIRRIRENSDREINNLRDENRRTMDRIIRSGSSYIDNALSSFYGLSSVYATNFSDKTTTEKIEYLKSEFERVVSEKEQAESEARIEYVEYDSY